LVLDVALLRPEKRGRFHEIAANNKELLRRLQEAGLIHAPHW
jgi:hypothetical protein